MGKGKIRVYIVTTANGDTTGARLIRGTIKEVEAHIRSEISIEPCTVEQARDFASVEIEDAQT